MADEATIVARACDKARAGLPLSLLEQGAVARAVLARVEEMEVEKADGEKKAEEKKKAEEEEKEKKEKKKKKKTKSKHHVATATEKMESLGVGEEVEDEGGEELVPSRTKAKKKVHARAVGVLGGLGGLDLDGDVAGAAGREDGEDDEEL